MFCVAVGVSIVGGELQGVGVMHLEGGNAMFAKGLSFRTEEIVARLRTQGLLEQAACGDLAAGDERGGDGPVEKNPWAGLVGYSDGGLRCWCHRVDDIYRSKVLLVYEMESRGCITQWGLRDRRMR